MHALHNLICTLLLRFTKDLIFLETYTSLSCKNNTQEQNIRITPTTCIGAVLESYQYLIHTRVLVRQLPGASVLHSTEPKLWQAPFHPLFRYFHLLKGSKPLTSMPTIVCTPTCLNCLPLKWVPYRRWPHMYEGRKGSTQHAEMWQI